MTNRGRAMTTTEITKRGKELFFISAPMIVEQLCITFMGLVSTWLVNSVGEYAVTAVGMVNSISNLIIALFAALTTGGTIVVAQMIGRQEIKAAKSAAGQSILLSFLFSLIIAAVLTVFQGGVINLLFGGAGSDVIEAANRFMFIVNFSYPILAVTQTIFGILRGSGNTGTPMLISVLMNVVNFALGLSLIRGINFWFIHTPSFGIEGVAFALLFARLIGFLTAGFYIVFAAKRVRLYKISYFKPNAAVQKTILGIGIPTSVESALFYLGKIITLIFIVGMGKAATTANSIGSSVFEMVNVPGAAFATGVMILVGQRIGRGETDDVERTTKFAISFGALALGIICLMVFIFQEQIIGAFNPSAETYGYLKQIFMLCFFATPLFWSPSFITPSALRATGDVRYTMYVATISMWSLRIVLGYVFGVTLGFGVIGIWFGMLADWIARGLLFYIRLIKGRWRNKGIAE